MLVAAQAAKRVVLTTHFTMVAPSGENTIDGCHIQEARLLHELTTGAIDMYADGSARISTGGDIVYPQRNMATCAELVRSSYIINKIHIIAQQP